jgi:hypothetical protein
VYVGPSCPAELHKSGANTVLRPPQTRPYEIANEKAGFTRPISDQGAVKPRGRVPPKIWAMAEKPPFRPATIRFRFETNFDITCDLAKKMTFLSRLFDGLDGGRGGDADYVVETEQVQGPSGDAEPRAKRETIELRAAPAYGRIALERYERAVSGVDEGITGLGGHHGRKSRVQLVLVGDVYLAAQAQYHAVGRNADNLGPKARVSRVRVFHVADPRDTAHADVRSFDVLSTALRRQVIDPRRPAKGPLTQPSQLAH